MAAPASRPLRLDVQPSRAHCRGDAMADRVQPRVGGLAVALGVRGEEDRRAAGDRRGPSMRQPSEPGADGTGVALSVSRWASASSPRTIPPRVPAPTPARQAGRGGLPLLVALEAAHHADADAPRVLCSRVEGMLVPRPDQRDDAGARRVALTLMWYGAPPMPRDVP